MNHLDRRLSAIAHQSLAVCRSVSDALAEVFSEDTRSDGVSLSLQSRYGTLVVFPEHGMNHTLDICSHPLLEPLASGENEERIALLLGSRRWYMVSSFSCAGIAFYPVITIPAPPDHLRWVRYEMLGALDCFHLKCKESILSFLNDMTVRPQNVAEKRGALEQRILDVLAGYSESVESAAIIDNDGFVLLAAGGEARAEEIAGTLALFNRRALSDLDALGAMEIRSLSTGGNDRTFLMGRVPQSGVSLAFSVRGKNAPVVARFLFDAGLSATRQLRDIPGTLGDYRLTPDDMPLTTRDGWLSSPRLVPRGAFVSIDACSVFHDPECPEAAANNTRTLHWYASRADAIKTGLTPCAVCAP